VLSAMRQTSTGHALGNETDLYGARWRWVVLEAQRAVMRQTSREEGLAGEWEAGE
jgi:hypothetical protein